MIRINRITDYINSGKLYDLLDKIYKSTSFINSEYKNYYEWYYNIQVPRILNNEGEIIYLTVGVDNIIGVISLKNTEYEKKICTLYIDSEYREMHLGTILLEMGLEYLETDKPVITFNERKKVMFQSFVDRYEWIETSRVNYLNRVELSYNDKTLVKKK